VKIDRTLIAELSSNSKYYVRAGTSLEQQRELVTDDKLK
jgi:hypothetical protein